MDNTTATPQHVQGYKARQRAQQDYRDGAGQDENPYSRQRQPIEWEAYAMEMHRLWAEEFKADQQGRP